MTHPGSGPSQVPPGFRFHPTDEELVNYYLRKKVALEKFDLDVIRDVDLNKLEPWDLHERCRIESTQQTEWYFFSHKDKKYPTGTRTNRATAAGFWKATGRDKAVHSNFKRIGMRKTLVFYRGRAPHGQKTDWIMHEYRLEESETGGRGNEDGWVVCRVFKKRSPQHKGNESQTFASEEEQSSLIDANSEYYKNFQGDAATSQTFFCKQELEFEECLPHVPFLQLPQLESPRNTCNTSFSNPPGARRIFTESYKRTEFSSPFSLEIPAMEGSNTKSLFICEDNLTDYAETVPLTEWSVLENMPKEIRYHPEFSNFSTDIPLPLHTSRQQPIEYPTTCEVDLWNFTR